MKACFLFVPATLALAVAIGCTKPAPKITPLAPAVDTGIHPLPPCPTGTTFLNFTPAGQPGSPRPFIGGGGRGVLVVHVDDPSGWMECERIK